MPEGWDDKPNVKRQNDEDARWAKKHEKTIKAIRTTSTSTKSTS